VNPIYSILESPHRWLILASLAFGAGVVGAIVMIVYDWPHDLARVWFYASLVVTLYCVGRGLISWKQAVEPALIETATPEQADSSAAGETEESAPSNPEVPA